MFNPSPTPAPNSSLTPQSTGSGGTSSRKIVGAVLGAVLGAGLILLGAYMLLRRRLKERRKLKQEPTMSELPGELPAGAVTVTHDEKKHIEELPGDKQINEVIGDHPAVELPSQSFQKEIAELPADPAPVREEKPAIIVETPEEREHDRRNGTL